MPDFLIQGLADQGTLSPGAVAARLILAMLLGGAVALAYRYARGNSPSHPSFAATLVLLAILIAMVTQVIGDNVARAFSLVGALSIVRFRTVVRDTQDTAFVIFAVVIGMAAGANKPYVALFGLFIVAFAAWFMNRQTDAASLVEPGYALTVRVGLADESEPRVNALLDEYLSSRVLRSVGTARQGVAISRVYDVRLKEPDRADEMVRRLNMIDGVQGVEFERRDQTEE